MPTPSKVINRPGTTAPGVCENPTHSNYVNSLSTDYSFFI